MGTGKGLYMMLVRGLPGVGKSTLAQSLSYGVFEADEWFERDGVYTFDPTQLPEAHADCLARVRRQLGGYEVTVVANTFSRRWEMQPYREPARDYNYTVVEVDLFDGGMTDAELAQRCVHNVPLSTISKMRQRWEK